MDSISQKILIIHILTGDYVRDGRKVRLTKAQKSSILDLVEEVMVANDGIQLNKASLNARNFYRKICKKDPHGVSQGPF